MRSLCMIALQHIARKTSHAAPALRISSQLLLTAGDWQPKLHGISCHIAGGVAGASRRPHQCCCTTPVPCSFQVHGADFCNCPDDDKAVCGTDQQTYLNECVMRCAGAIKLRVRRHAVAAAGCGLGSLVPLVGSQLRRVMCCAGTIELRDTWLSSSCLVSLQGSMCNKACYRATNPLHQLRWPFCCLAAGRRVQQGLLPARREA